MHHKANPIFLQTKPKIESDVWRRKNNPINLVPCCCWGCSNIRSNIIENIFPGIMSRPGSTLIQDHQLQQADSLYDSISSVHSFTSHNNGKYQFNYLINWSTINLITSSRWSASSVHGTCEEMEPPSLHVTSKSYLLHPLHRHCISDISGNDLKYFYYHQDNSCSLKLFMMSFC